MGRRKSPYMIFMTLVLLYVIIFPMTCSASSGRDSVSVAADLALSLRSAADSASPLRHDFYNYDRYDRYTVALNKIAADDTTNLFLKNFGFAKEYVDSSDVTLLPILPIVIREKSSKVLHRRTPRSTKSVVSGVNYKGLDEITDSESLQTYYEDALKEIDVFKDYVTLFHYRFASPFSSKADKLYKFEITDTVTIDSIPHIELSFTPLRSRTLGFTGKVFVEVGDSSHFVRRISMFAPCAGHISFIDRVFVDQQFRKAPDGSMLKTMDDLTVEVDLVKHFQDFYARRTTVYYDHSFDISARDDSVFSRIGNEFMLPDAERVNELFWYYNRPIQLRGNERNISVLSDHLHSHPVYNWSEKIVKFLLDWYIPTGHHSKFDIGPVDDFYNHNAVEGLRLGLGGTTTSFMSPHLFAKVYAGYGFGDKTWKYKGEIEYSFTRKRYHPREFPVNSVRFSYSYDVDRIGRNYEFSDPDNLLSVFKRMDDKLLTYRRIASLEYNFELRNHLSFHPSVSHRRQESTRWTPFIDGYNRIFSHYSQSLLKLKVRYAPAEKFLQWRDSRTTIDFDTPVFSIAHTVSPKGLLGNHFTINYSEVGYRQRFWLASCGYTDLMIKGGHIWSQVAYPDLCVPNANISYTIQPESFSLLNPMEFAVDSYAMWNLTYYLNGALLHYIPLLKRMDVREVVAFRGFFGHLSHKNDPALNPNVFRFPYEAHVSKLSPGTPYMEASVGIENIFSLLRIDYVWRLTYRHLPDIKRGGIRFAIYFSL